MKKYNYCFLIIFCLISLYTPICCGKAFNEGTIEKFLDFYNESDGSKKFDIIDQVAEISDIKEAPFLRKLLDSGIDELKVAAITALGNIPSKADAPLLHKYLLDQNSLIRIVSARALLKMGDNSGVETLHSILIDSESYCSEIPYILEALSLDNSETTIVSLKKFIKSDRCKNNYEGEALISLGKIGGKESINFLGSYLDSLSKHDINRTYAIEALCLSDHPAAIERLKMIIKNKDESEFNKSLIRTYLKDKK